jgi:hypothetical protein
MKSLPLAVLMLAMVGCRDTSVPAPTTPVESAQDRAWKMLFFNLEYTKLLNEDTSAILHCTTEEMRIGNDHGPVCHEACKTMEDLMAFQKSHAALLNPDDEIYKQHDWCLPRKDRRRKR